MDELSGHQQDLVKGSRGVISILIVSARQASRAGAYGDARSADGYGIESDANGAK
jgi:hypothetical protein